MTKKKQSTPPAHVAIVMDGNRRWARKNGHSLMRGHERGYERALEIAEHAFSRGVRYLTIYAFSVLNWNRTKYEVTYLMRLLHRMFSREIERLHAENIKVRIVGTRQKLSADLIASIDDAESLTRNNTGGTLVVAFNYEGRREIADTVQAIMRERIPAAKISTTTVAQHLYTAGIPDPDLVIRTSGEYRLSGFLTWQTAHSELYFTKTLWPAFTTRHFDAVLKEYAKRQRRFGK